MGNEKVNSRQSKRRERLSSLGIVLFTLIIYLPGINNSFLNWDDNWYIAHNTFISDFTMSGIVNMFTHLFHSQYSPLVMVVLSFLKSTFGLNPIPFHLVSLFFHFLNAYLIFRFIGLLTGKTNLALLISAFFAVHPLQVESVAWMSAMKIVVSTSFLLISLIYYIKYRNTGKLGNYYLSLLVFVAAMLSKEQTLVLPLMIIAIDYFHDRKLFDRKVVFEKIPYFFLSGLFVIVTIVAVYTQGFEGEIPSFNMYVQIEFVLYSLLNYLSKFILPINLSSYYPYPSSINYYYLVFPILMVAFVIISIKRKLLTKKEILFAIAFFLINIFLTFQIVPVRKIYMADRYMYLPMIGVLLVFGFVFARLFSLDKKNRNYLIPVVSLFFLLFFTLSFSRVKTWESSLSLWDDVIYKTGRTYFPLLKRGISYRQGNNYDAALSDLSGSIDLQPDNYYAFEERGYIYLIKEDYILAKNDFIEAARLHPKSSYAYCSLGFAQMELGDYQGALGNLNKAIELESDYADAYKNRGEVYASLNDTVNLCKDFNMAIKLGLSGEDEQEAIGQLDKFCDKNDEPED
jgi:tetratricopeptide (TPR) repeat protein